MHRLLDHWLPVARLIVGIALAVIIASTTVAQESPKPNAKKPTAPTDCKEVVAVPDEAASDFVLPPRQGKSETIRLFNGKDFTGWMGHEKYWTVRDGEIIGSNNKPVKVSTYLLTEQSFTDFRLLATVKLIKDKIHSGVVFWGRVAPERGDKYTFAGHLLMFPYDWGLYDVYGRSWLYKDDGRAKKAGQDHEWNELEIVARGNRIRMAINGADVLDWRDPSPKALYEGPIGLQLHANKMPQEIHYKDLVVTTFPTDELVTVKK